MILNSNNQVLLLFQTQGRFWEFPKGKVEEGESDEETMMREVQEEAGIQEFALLPGMDEEIHYEFETPEGTVDKTVRFFAVRTSQEPRISSEHLDYRWVTIQEAQQLLTHGNYQYLLGKLSEIL